MKLLLILIKLLPNCSNGFLWNSFMIWEAVLSRLLNSALENNRMAYVIPPVMVLLSMTTFLLAEREILSEVAVKIVFLPICALSAFTRVIASPYSFKPEK